MPGLFRYPEEKGHFTTLNPDPETPQHVFEWVAIAIAMDEQRSTPDPGGAGPGHALAGIRPRYFARTGWVGQVGSSPGGECHRRLRDPAGDPPGRAGCGL